MDFSDLIRKRRSIRKFSDKKLEAEQVQAILQAGLMAPSSKNSTPWQFILVEDKDVLVKLSQSKEYGSKPIAECALAIVVLADPFASDVWIEDASIASIMMQLQAEDLGLGSCWIQIRDRETAANTSSEEFVKEILDIPMQMQVLAILAIGNKAQERSPHDEDKLQWEKIHIGKFNYNTEE